MKTYTVILGVLLCLVAVNGRHYVERSETETSSDERDEQMGIIRKAKEHSAGQMRHRRKRWQMNYGYNYPVPQNPYYSDERNYDRAQQDIIPRVLRLLDEISAYIKRPAPPSPPQPIYIPYPVPYPIPQYCNCPSQGPSKGPSKKPNITSRFPEMEDTNQNWGFAGTDKEDEDDSDGRRPISFDPIKPQRPTTRPPPEVDHGSSQAASDMTTRSPVFLAKEERTPGLSMCDAAVLSCCRPTDNMQLQRKCFIDLGCGTSFANGSACKQASISAVLEKFSKTYSPR